MYVFIGYKFYERRIPKLYYNDEEVHIYKYPVWRVILTTEVDELL